MGLKEKLKTYDWETYKKELKRSLSNNVEVNEVLSPIYFILILFLLKYYYNVIPLWNGFFHISLIHLSFLSTVIYVYSSNFFQPDLDVLINRPGMNHFPLGKWVDKTPPFNNMLMFFGLEKNAFFIKIKDIFNNIWRFIRFLKWLFYPINVVWYYMWQPYASLLTHRGLGHIPIISTIIRAYVLMFYLFILKVIIFSISFYLLPYINFVIPILKWHINFGDNFIDFLNISIKNLRNFMHISEFGYKIIHFLSYFDYWLKNFFIKGNFLSFLILNFPIYTADVAHIAVDYYDSVKRGTSFCPPKIPRGLIYRTYKFFVGGKQNGNKVENDKEKSN